MERTPQLPQMRDVTASSLHRAADNCKHEFLRVPGHDDKLDYLRTLIDKDVRNGDQTMVFCNTVDSCRAVQHAMSEAQVWALTISVRHVRRRLCVCVCETSRKARLRVLPSAFLRAKTPESPR